MARPTGQLIDHRGTRTKLVPTKSGGVKTVRKTTAEHKAAVTRQKAAAAPAVAGKPTAAFDWRQNKNLTMSHQKRVVRSKVRKANEKIGSHDLPIFPKLKHYTPAQAHAIVTTFIKNDPNFKHRIKGTELTSTFLGEGNKMRARTGDARSRQTINQFRHAIKTEIEGTDAQAGAAIRKYNGHDPGLQKLSNMEIGAKARIEGAKQSGPRAKALTKHEATRGSDVPRESGGLLGLTGALPIVGKLPIVGEALKGTDMTAGKILEEFSRPVHAVGGALHEYKTHGNVLKGALEGLENKTRYLPSDSVSLGNSGASKFATDLAINIGGDPLSWTGAGVALRSPASVLSRKAQTFEREAKMAMSDAAAAESNAARADALGRARTFNVKAKEARAAAKAAPTNKGISFKVRKPVKGYRSQVRNHESSAKMTAGVSKLIGLSKVTEKIKHGKVHVGPLKGSPGQAFLKRFAPHTYDPTGVSSPLMKGARSIESQGRAAQVKGADYGERVGASVERELDKLAPKRGLFGVMSRDYRNRRRALEIQRDELKARHEVLDSRGRGWTPTPGHAASEDVGYAAKATVDGTVGSKVGKFGTGVRFTDDASAGSGHAVIDLTGKTLFKPTTVKEAKALDSTLAKVDRLSYSYGADNAGRLAVDTKAFNEVVNSLPNPDGLTKQQLKATLADALHEARTSLDSAIPEADRASTHLMRALGWDGVDTRGLDSNLPSVLYRDSEVGDTLRQAQEARVAYHAAESDVAALRTSRLSDKEAADGAALNPDALSTVSGREAVDNSIINAVEKSVKNVAEADRITRYWMHPSNIRRNPYYARVYSAIRTPLVHATERLSNATKDLKKSEREVTRLRERAQRELGRAEVDQRYRTARLRGFVRREQARADKRLEKAQKALKDSDAREVYEGTVEEARAVLARTTEVAEGLSGTGRTAEYKIAQTAMNKAERNLAGIEGHLRRYDRLDAAEELKAQADQLASNAVAHPANLWTVEKLFAGVQVNEARVKKLKAQKKEAEKLLKEEQANHDRRMRNLNDNALQIAETFTRSIVDRLPKHSIEELPQEYQKIAVAVRDIMEKQGLGEMSDEILRVMRPDYMPHVMARTVEDRNAVGSSLKNATLHADKRRKLNRSIAEVNYSTLKAGRGPMFVTNPSAITAHRLKEGKTAQGIHEIHQRMLTEEFGGEKIATNVKTLRQLDEQFNAGDMAIYSVTPKRVELVMRDALDDGGPSGNGGRVAVERILQSKKDGPELYAIPRPIAEHIFPQGSGPMRAQRDIVHDVMDQVVFAYKQMLTVLNVPAYDLRNAVGDTWNAYLADTTFRDIKDAAKAIGADVGQHREQTNLFRQQGATASHKVDILGTEIPTVDLIHMAEKYGVYPGYLGGEGFEALHGGRGFVSVRNQETGLLPKVVGGRGFHPVRSLRAASEQRERTIRLATFISGLRKGMDPAEAAAHSNWYHIDYGALSDAEKNIRRYIMPFYSFLSRNTRIQLRAAFENPAKFSRVQILRETGASNSGLGPNWEDQLAPYQQRGAGIPIPWPGRKAPMLLFPQLPLTDLSRFTPSVQGQFDQMMGAVYGPYKMIAEAGLNRSFFFGSTLWADEDNPTAKVDVPGPDVRSVPVVGGVLGDIMGARTQKDGTKTISAKADWFTRGLTPQTNLALQVLTKGTGSRGGTGKLQLLSQGTGVRFSPWDANKNKSSKLNDIINQTELKMNTLNRRKQSRLADGSHWTPEYVKAKDKHDRAEKELKKILKAQGIDVERKPRGLRPGEPIPKKRRKKSGLIGGGSSGGNPYAGSLGGGKKSSLVGMP